MAATPKTITVKLTDEQELKLLRDQRQQINESIEQLELEKTKVNVKIIKKLRAMNKKEWVSDGLSTQIVQKHRQTIDWDAIKRNVGPEIWSEIVQEVPNLEALNKVLKRGRVKVSDVAPYIVEEPVGDPHIRVGQARSEGE